MQSFLSYSSILIMAVVIYSQFLIKQRVWGPYNRSGPYKELFFWEHRRKLPLWLFSLVLLHRRELSLQALGYSVYPGLLAASAGKQHASSRAKGTDKWKTQSWAQKSTEMMGLIRSWLQIISIPVDVNFPFRPRLPVTSPVTAGCVWWATKAHAHETVVEKA